MKHLSRKSEASLFRRSNGSRVAAKEIFSRLIPRAAVMLFVSMAAVPGQAQTLSSVSISPNNPTVVIGGTTQLTATATYSDGSTNNVSGVTWSSADPRLVNVSSSGSASGFATGNVVITASYQGKTATTTVSSSIGDIQWSGPINITQGGTYSGNWKSTNPNTAAVTISTSQPVTIQNSYVTGPADLINASVYGNNLTVKNVIGIGLNPNVSGQGYGVFVDTQNSANLDVENSYFENVRFGVYMTGYAGNRDGSETVTILNNRGRNLLGVESNGNNGTLAGESNWVWSHAIQISEAYGVPGIQIAWNEIINYPSQSLVNEIVSMFQSGGTSGSPAAIHDNFIQGAYAYNPAVDSYNGGGLVTDGNSSDTVKTASSFNNFYNNQVVGTVNMGIEIGNGHDNAAYNNRVLSAGLLPNGTKIPSQNVGLSLYDVYGNIANGSFYNNNMYNNTVGWMCWAARCAWDGYRNDEWFPLNGSYYSTNTSISANPITLAMEAAEYQTWLGKISSDGKSVGPTASGSSDSSGSGSGGSGSGGSGSGGSGGSGSSTSGISTTAWYTIVNTNSTLCLGSANGSTTAGAALQQNTCGTAQTQQWQFQTAADSGYYQVVNRAASSASNLLVWDITGGAWQTADSVPVQLYTSKVETNEEWMPVSVGNGAYKFVVKNSNKCLDVPGASSAVQLQLQQFDCNGTGAQSFTLKQQ